MYQTFLNEFNNKPGVCASSTESSLPSVQSPKKWPPAQRFGAQAADRPIRVLLTQPRATWLGWLPGTGHLPHAERFYYFYLNSIKYKLIYSIFQFWTLHSKKEIKFACAQISRGVADVSCVHHQKYGVQYFQMYHRISWDICSYNKRFW